MTLHRIGSFPEIFRLVPEKKFKLFFREVGPQAKLMPDLHTFASVILAKKLVPGSPELSKVYFKGFFENI